MSHLKDKEDKEKLIRSTIYLEDEHIEALEKLASEYSRTLGQRWTKGAVVRLAVSDFLSKMGRIS